MGFGQLQLVVTDKRIVAVHKAKKDARYWPLRSSWEVQLSLRGS